jgi:hypothetical protein
MEPIGVITAIQLTVFKVKYGKKENLNWKCPCLLKLHNLNSNRRITKNAERGQEQTSREDQLPSEPLIMVFGVFLSLVLFGLP